MANRALAAKAARAKSQRIEMGKAEYSKSAYLMGKPTFGDDIKGSQQSWAQYSDRQKRLSAPLHHAKPRATITGPVLAAWTVDQPRLIKRADYLRGKR
jgi:hypothetical protein